MSFHFEFYATDPDRAKHLLAKNHAPATVAAFIGAALDGLAQSQVGKKYVVHVKANGHLHTGQDYADTTANIEVKPLILMEP